MLERLLDITRKLAAPYELTTMLTEVIDAGRAMLNADRASVFLYDRDRDELYTTTATGVDEIRFPAARGLAGECARSRRAINVPDCYADPRFNREVDQTTGYHTRCMLSVPLIGHDDVLVGVLQLLNKNGGVFVAEDEQIASAVAAQCAVALQRVRLIADMVARKKLEHEMVLAHEAQQRVFPTQMPTIPGYDIAAWSRQADQTGGDIYDVISLDGHRHLLLLGDATGHGLAPALSITQFRAMLRMAVRMGASLDAAYASINEQLVEDLPDNKFVTAFLGLFDASAHTVTYHSGGQGPLLHFHAATGACEWHGATTVPMGMLGGLPLAQPQVFELEAGDVIVLASDGVLEYPNTAAEQFGTERVGDLVRAGQGASMAELIDVVRQAVDQFGTGVIQPDDMSMLVLKRQ
ncbi:MAG: SpoIIE family protein phosphatase [Vicinamibacterales bacterium]